MNHILKVENLGKRIGKKEILHGVTFSVRPGEIMGFLGPNGAGKTTTIKMILGLLRIDSGKITVGGYDAVTQAEQARAMVGGIIENPEMYGYMTGRRNLQVYANMYEGIDQARIEEVITQVKLGNRIDDKVRKYSLGMRQRLGVAQAIMHRPKLLILDEPTNGLDPVGIKELRDTLRYLTEQEGVGVLVSSHQLAEMELMCDRVCIIDEGRVTAVRQLRDAAVPGTSDVELSTPTVFEVQNSEQAHQVIQVMLPELDITHTSGGLQVVCTRQQRALVVKALVGAGIDIYAAVPRQASLEDLFIETTVGSQSQIN